MSPHPVIVECEDHYKSRSSTENVISLVDVIITLVTGNLGGHSIPSAISNEVGFLCRYVFGILFTDIANNYIIEGGAADAGTKSKPWLV